MIEGPSWLGIGAQRCGTTWFTELLIQHPQLGLSGGIKEQHLLYRYGFNRAWTPAAREEYRGIFSSDRLMLGEFTPYYLRAPWIAEMVADALPEGAPVLVLVRDPIDRFGSAIRREMILATGRYKQATRKDLRGRFVRTFRRISSRLPALDLAVRRAEDRIAVPPGKKSRVKNLLRDVASDTDTVRGPAKKAPDAFFDPTWLRFVGSDASWAGMYAAQLDAWTAVLPGERLIVIQYEKLRRNPQHYADLVWSRLGLRSVPLEEITRPSGSSTVPETWAPENYPGVIRALQGMYRPDAERLANRFDIDLALWKRLYPRA